MHGQNWRLCCKTWSKFHHWYGNGGKYIHASTVKPRSSGSREEVQGNLGHHDIFGPNLSLRAEKNFEACLVPLFRVWQSGAPTYLKVLFTSQSAPEE